MQMISDDEILKLKAECFIEVGSTLMSAGANTGRIRFTIERMAKPWKVKSEFMITNRVLLMTLSDFESEKHITLVKTIPVHSINFRLISGISKLSWQVAEQNANINEVNTELDRLKALPHFNRWLVLLIIGFAGFAFCYNMGGTFIDSTVTFFATMIGMFIRQETHKKGFNPYLTITFSAFSATFIAALYTKFFISNTNDYYSLATSVLFLIPGLPLINSFSDFIDGNHLNGLLRSLNALIISFAIALGFLISWVLFKL